MTTVNKSIEVDAPLQAVYNQWTQFEDFPKFMEGVERIDQLDDETLEWHINLAGADRHFRARIEEQRADERIAWRAVDDEQAGIVTFAPVGPSVTRVDLEMTYDTDGWVEKVADFLNMIEVRVERDLERFKHFIEGRDGVPTGEWRGEIDHEAFEEDTAIERSDDPPPAPIEDQPESQGVSTQYAPDWTEDATTRPLLSDEEAERDRSGLPPPDGIAP